MQEQTGQGKLELTVQERRLRWFGHIQRMSDERIAKHVLHWMPESRIKRNLCFSNVRTQSMTIAWRHFVQESYDL